MCVNRTKYLLNQLITNNMYVLFSVTDKNEEAVISLHMTTHPLFCQEKLELYHDLTDQWHT